jgi:hypothetical protein
LQEGIDRLNFQGIFELLISGDGFVCERFGVTERVEGNRIQTKSVASLSSTDRISTKRPKKFADGPGKGSDRPDFDQLGVIETGVAFDDVRRLVQILSENEPVTANHFLGLAERASSALTALLR